ncbi:dTMP kinase [Ihubacter sp. rT4E-8]|uniref:dTMP kinase n=1 Tax=Ihubacter sp. rT4E-8 TaxID=3242369 RepID=UPI003CF45786
MEQGLFITMEGPDGSGKSTQIAYLKEYFDMRGIDTIFTREPGGTPIGEKIRDIILDKANGEMCDMAEALLYAASRSQHVHQLIKPALSEGKIVICDRFIDSSIAYQGYGRQLGDAVRVINELAIEGCMPDITFLMELSPEIGKSRIKLEYQDRLELEKLEFHNRVFDGYQEIAQIYPERFVCVNAGRPKEVVRDEIYHHIDRLLQNRGASCR